MRLLRRAIAVPIISKNDQKFCRDAKIHMFMREESLEFKINAYAARLRLGFHKGDVFTTALALVEKIECDTMENENERNMILACGAISLALKKLDVSEQYDMTAVSN